MADKSHHSLEKLRIAADVTRELAARMTELRQLRAAVQRAEDATMRRRPTQRCDKANTFREEGKQHKECKALPGRLFMQSQWQ